MSKSDKEFSMRQVVSLIVDQCRVSSVKSTWIHELTHLSLTGLNLHTRHLAVKVKFPLYCDVVSRDVVWGDVVSRDAVSREAVWGDVVSRHTSRDTTSRDTVSRDVCHVTLQQARGERKRKEMERRRLVEEQQQRRRDRERVQREKEQQKQRDRDKDKDRDKYKDRDKDKQRDRDTAAAATTERVKSNDDEPAPVKVRTATPLVLYHRITKKKLVNRILWWFIESWNTTFFFIALARASAQHWRTILI